MNDDFSPFLRKDFDFAPEIPFLGLVVEHLYFKFGDPSCIRF